MKTIDRFLENLVKEVEIYGRSGAESIYTNNLSFTVSASDFTIPETSPILVLTRAFGSGLSAKMQGLTARAGTFRLSENTSTKTSTPDERFFGTQEHLKRLRAFSATTSKWISTENWT